MNFISSFGSSSGRFTSGAVKGRYQETGHNRSNTGHASLSLTITSNIFEDNPSLNRRQSQSRLDLGTAVLHTNYTGQLKIRFKENNACIFCILHAESKNLCQFFFHHPQFLFSTVGYVKRVSWDKFQSSCWQRVKKQSELASKLKGWNFLQKESEVSFYRKRH